MDDIIEYGEVKRGILGVELREVTSGTAEAYGLDRPKGVLIGRVILETPAEKAGLKADDIILSVDGQEVNRPNQLQSIIGRKRPDDTITLGIFRRGKNRTITATLTDKIPEDMQQTTSHQRPEKSKEISEIGITVQDITPELSRQAGLPKDIEGVLVTDASRQARRAGFIRGDVIQSVLQYPIEIDIRSVKDFEDALTKLKKGRSAIFHVKNGGRRRPVEIRIPQ
jgi:serine protease Do